MNKYIYYILCLTILIGACRSDEFRETVVEQNPTGTGQLTAGDVAGLIVDKNGTGIQDAVVTLANKTRTTDANGYFKFKAIEVDEAGSVVRISKDNYFDNYKFVYTELGTQSYMRVTMVEAVETGRFQSSEIGVAAESSGAGILFPADAIAMNGAPYSGEVIVRSHWYDPSEAALAATMPGDLRGINASDEIVQLATLGMMAVELSAPDGSELQLAEGKTATLTFPLSPEMVDEVPDEVPLWSLNELTGVWEEEGQATLVGDRMVGEVSHFSFWNCDVPYPLIEIEGKLETRDGDPIPNYIVSIQVMNSLLTRSGVTNNDGVFTGKVPRDEPLNLIVKHCGVEVLNEELGVITTSDIGTFVVNFLNVEKPISGRLVDCFGTALPHAYVILKTGNSLELLVPDADGRFSGVVVGCGTEEVTAKAFDPLNISESDVISISFDNDPLLIGDWELCGQLEERIVFTMNGGVNNILSEARVSLVNDEFIHIYSKDEVTGFTFDTQVRLTDAGTESPFVTTIRGLDENDDQLYATCNSSFVGSTGSSCADAALTISNFGTVGDWVTGTLSGIMYTDSLAISEVEIDANFQLYLDEDIQTGTLQGKVWNDANEDGIQDAGEDPISRVFINISGPPGSGDRARIYNPLNLNLIGVVSDDNGEYTITGLVPGEGYTLTWSDLSHYDATLANQGSDLADSDYELRSGSLFAYDYVIDEFTDSGLEANVDLGLIIKDLSGALTTRGCGDDVVIEVFPRGGLPPYQVTLDGMTTLPLGETVFENVTSGDHVVSFEDQSGLEWTGNITTYEFKNFIRTQLWLDVAGGTPDVRDNSDQNFGEVEMFLKRDGEVIETQYTDVFGRGLFEFLEPGSYEVEVTVPAGFELVQKSVGNDVNNDSDIDPVTRLSDPIIFDDCEEYINLAAGFREL